MRWCERAFSLHLSVFYLFPQHHECICSCVSSLVCARLLMLNIVLVACFRGWLFCWRSLICCCTRSVYRVEVVTMDIELCVWFLVYPHSWMQEEYDMSWMKMAGAELMTSLPEACTAISAMHESLFLLIWCGLGVVAIYIYGYNCACIWIYI